MINYYLMKLFFLLINQDEIKMWQHCHNKKEQSGNALFLRDIFIF